MNEATLQYALAHADDDVRQLALRGCKDPMVNLPLALQQIEGRQTARRKLPAWAANDGIVYPPHLSLEQCSSEATARYKASLVSGDSLVDLTAGFGVDCYFMAQAFRHAVAVELQHHLCEIAKYNFHLLNCDKIEVINGDAETYLNQMKPTDVIFIDPARRDTAGRRTYGIADCTPDVTHLAPTLLEKARTVMIKLSPMLDISQVIATLPCVTDVHIVSVAGECKELLVLMSATSIGNVVIHCINDGKTFDFHCNDEVGNITFWNEQCETARFVYEPNASIMKAGCFNQVANHYGVTPVSSDSHLFVSDKCVDELPGRTFVIDAITMMNKGELKKSLEGITHANVAVRNFPMRADELQKRLRLKDGGNTFIFGTTTASGRHIIMLCHKISNDCQ